MNPREYVKNVLVTEARNWEPVQKRLMEEKNIRLLHACAGISSEIAELIELNNEFDKELDRVNLMEELGDILWYVGIASNALDAIDEITEESPFSGRFMKDDDDLNDCLLSTILKLSAFSGELVDKAVKKTVFYGKAVDPQTMISDLKAIHTNVKFLLGNAGFTLEQAREKNIAKLKARYGEKFTEAAALERNLDAERKILERK